MADDEMRQDGFADGRSPDPLACPGQRCADQDDQGRAGGGTPTSELCASDAIYYTTALSIARVFG